MIAQSASVKFSRLAGTRAPAEVSWTSREESYAGKTADCLLKLLAAPSIGATIMHS